MKYIPIILLSIILFCIPQEGFAQKKHNKKAISLYNEAETLTFSGKMDLAIEKLNEAIKIEPEYLTAINRLAFIYQVKKKDYKKALELFSSILKIDRNFITAYYNKAICAFNIQDYNTSKNSIEKFLSYDIAIKYRNEGDIVLKNIIFSESAVKNSTIIEFKNLGSNVNSVDKEYFPSVTSDNRYLYFTTKKTNEGYANENIYYSEKINDKWGPKKKLNTTINSESNEGSHCISSNGKYLLFASDNYKHENFGRFDIYISKKIGSNWKTPKNMGSNINSRSWDSQPVLSADSKKIFFVSQRKGGFGGSDIYISTVENGKFGEPKNIGNIINTPFDEQRPYLHPDGKTLYFASAGHPGMGAIDLFKSTLDENGNWSTPENLGFPINTSGSEFGVFISADGNTAYVSSDRKGGFGNQDIYSFSLPENLKPELVSYIKGTVTDEATNKPIKSNIKLFDLENGNIYKTFSSDEINGEFLETIIAGKDYALETEVKGYLPFSENISLKKIKKNEAFLFNVELQRIEAGKEIVLNNIFFKTNEYTLLEISKVELRFFIKFLKNNIKVNIEIEGHTDNVGSSSSNLTLSENRAKAVYTFLNENGISKDRISYKGFGDTKPISSNENEKGKAKNRRTSFVVK